MQTPLHGLDFHSLWVFFAFSPRREESTNRKELFWFEFPSVHGCKAVVSITLFPLSINLIKKIRTPKGYSGREFQTLLAHFARRGWDLRYIFPTPNVWTPFACIFAARSNLQNSHTGDISLPSPQKKVTTLVFSNSSSSIENLVVNFFSCFGSSFFSYQNLWTLLVKHKVRLTIISTYLQILGELSVIKQIKKREKEKNVGYFSEGMGIVVGGSDERNFSSTCFWGGGEFTVCKWKGVSFQFGEPPTP